MLSMVLKMKNVFCVKEEDRRCVLLEISLSLGFFFLAAVTL